MMTYIVRSERNPLLSMQVTEGHFATSNAHISHYLDMTTLKTNVTVAKDVARELAVPYLSREAVDTIICMENTEVIGAYLAEELVLEGLMVMNSSGKIHVITPMLNMNGQLIFNQSEHKYIKDRNVVLLVASVSSGKTVARSLECINYYSGRLVGISALFSAAEKNAHENTHAIFTAEDIPGYTYARASKCELCQNGQKLSAIVNSLGFTEFHGADDMPR